MKRLRGKLTYANVISTLCLIVLVGGGTAYATSQLPKNSVGPRQIKPGAVTPVKLSQASKRTLTGPQGPKGDRGERGEKGEQGARGPSNAIAKFDPGAFSWSTTYTTVESLSLDPGSWVITASGVAVNHEGTAEGAECRLLLGATTIDESGELFLAAFPGAGAKQAVSLTGGATAAAAGTVDLQCQATFANGQLVNPAITAIQVGALRTE